MKTQTRLLILLVFLLVLFPRSACAQKLATGLYKLEDAGSNKLTLDGKIYYADNQAIATIKNFVSVNITQDKVRMQFYDLNIKLDEEGTKKLSAATAYAFHKANHFGLVINGELLNDAQGITPITSGRVTINDRSLAKQEDIARRLRKEMGK